jgi:hypothetical protein
MSSFRSVRHAAFIAAALALAASPALAQTFGPIKFMGGAGQVLKQGPIVVPSYQAVYFTSQQGTAVGGVLTKSRLTTSLANVPEATMRKLADEAHADLVAQLKAANVPMADGADAKAQLTAAGLYAPTNSDITTIGRSVTIGQSVKKAYAAFGAKDAPLIAGLHNPNPGGMSVIGMMQSVNRLAPVAKAQQSVILAPMLAIDFADTSAKGGKDFLGRDSANVSSRVQFALSGSSKVAIMASMLKGRASAAGGLNMAPKDFPVATPFARVETGDGAVRAMSIATVTNASYIDQEAARGDAVVVDLPIWEGLVRAAYKDFNAGVVAEVRKAQGV